MASSQQPRRGERTAAQREAARAERERRRAARGGNLLLAETDSPGEQPSEQSQQHIEAKRHMQAAQAGPPEQAQQPGQAEQPEQAASPTQAEQPTRAALLVRPVQPERQADSGLQEDTPLPVSPKAAAPRRSEVGRRNGRGGGRKGGGVRDRGGGHQGRGRRGGGGGRPDGAHSVRARFGAVGALVAVALAAWGVVLLVQHFKGSGGASEAVSKPPVVKVVIPEGETRGQIAAIARKDGLQGDYLRASVHNSGLEPRRFGAPAGTPSLEGFLFPATYDLPVHGNVSRLVAAQLEAFQERFGPREARSARALHLSVYRLLIVASMVEREALLPHDRPLVAAVIYNRLRLGMPLGIDATLRFALKDWEKPLTEAQLRTPSPYNTRLHKGLPPTPISNPGVESMQAAAHPAHAGYLYYVDAANGCGELVFSNTFAEFERDSAAYQEALRSHGGHVPACKHR